MSSRGSHLPSSSLQSSNGTDHQYRQSIDNRYKQKANLKSKLSTLHFITLILSVIILTLITMDLLTDYPHFTFSFLSPWLLSVLSLLCGEIFWFAYKGTLTPPLSFGIIPMGIEIITMGVIFSFLPKISLSLPTIPLAVMVLSVFNVGGRGAMVVIMRRVGQLNLK